VLINVHGSMSPGLVVGPGLPPLGAAELDGAGLPTGPTPNPEDGLGDAWPVPVGAVVPTLDVQAPPTRAAAAMVIAARRPMAPKMAAV